MAKKIAGNYPDTDAVADLMDSLEATGFPVESITVIADADLVDMDAIDLELEDGFDLLSAVSDELLRERIESYFDDEDDGAYSEEITAYCGSLRDGDILLLVEDDLLPEDGEAYAILFGEEDAQADGKPAKRTSAKGKAKAAPKANAKAKTEPKAKEK